MCYRQEGGGSLILSGVTKLVREEQTPGHDGPINVGYAPPHI